MKLPIKKVWFDQIKKGKKKIEYRDAHITFVCEETGEMITKDVTACDIMKLNEGPEEAIKDGSLKDNNLICFWLGSNGGNKKVKKKKPKEVNIKKYLKNIDEELAHYRKTGIPRCPHCKKDFAKIEKDSGKTHSVWEPACDCVKKKLRMCIG